MYIKTKRLEIRPIADQHLEALIELFTDDVVKQTYMVPDFASKEEAAKLATRIQTLSQDPGRYVAGLCLDGQLIGIFNDTDVEGKRIEMGYALLPRFHNQGYCAEAFAAVIDYLFAQGFREVVAGAFESNAASLRVMVKCGMERLEQENQISYRGKTHRCIYYSKKAV